MAKRCRHRWHLRRYHCQYLRLAFYPAPFAGLPIVYGGEDVETSTVRDAVRCPVLPVSPVSAMSLDAACAVFSQ
jgi:hypothetical protein